MAGSSEAVSLPLGWPTVPWLVRSGSRTWTGLRVRGIRLTKGAVEGYFSEPTTGGKVILATVHD